MTRSNNESPLRIAASYVKVGVLDGLDILFFARSNTFSVTIPDSNAAITADSIENLRKKYDSTRVASKNRKKISVPVVILDGSDNILKKRTLKGMHMGTGQWRFHDKETNETEQVRAPNVLPLSATEKIQKLEAILKEYSDLKKAANVKEEALRADRIKLRGLENDIWSFSKGEMISLRSPYGGATIEETIKKEAEAVAILQGGSEDSIL